MKLRIIYFLILCGWVGHSCTFKFIDQKTRDGVLSQAFFKELVDTFKPSIFFETGTFNGRNAKAASQYFNWVHSVELGEELYNEAQNALRSASNVTLYHGSSPDVINQVAPHLKGHIVFWLDAHYSGGNTVLSNDNMSDPDAVTAIRNELKTIKENKIQDCTILIDDMRGFGSVINGTEYLGCWAYPSVQELCQMGKEINPNFSFALIGDIFLMYDASQFNPELSEIVKACTASRLYDGVNISDKDLIACEKIIMHAQGAERDFIVDLYRRMTDWKDPMFNHDLWYGLVSMGSGKWQDAKIAMQKVTHRVEYFDKNRNTVEKHLNYNHWRLYSYLQKIEAN